MPADFDLDSIEGASGGAVIADGRGLVLLVGDLDDVEGIPVADEDLKNRIWQKDWTMFYPNGPEGAEYGIIRFAPKVARG